MKMDEVLEDINQLRLLVFLECDQEECEDGGIKVNDGAYRHFHQVKLTSRQFKRVSDAVIMGEKADPGLKKGYNLAEVRVGGTFSAQLFDGLSSTID